MRRTIVVFATFLFLLLPTYFFAQKSWTINFVTENPQENGEFSWFEKKIQEEIEALLKNRVSFQFEVVHTGYDIAKIEAAFDEAYQDPTVDIVISIGAISSGILAGRKEYPKPTIASIIINSEIQQIPITKEGSSGIKNFTYIQSPFSLERDLKSLYRLHPFKKVGVMGGSNLINFMPYLNQIVEEVCQELEADFDIISYSGTVENTLNNIPEDIESIYFLPINDEMSPEELRQFFGEINQRGIASSALLGKQYLDMGAIMGYDADANLQRMPRRLAINVSKIIEGQNPANLPVIIPTYSDNLLINMQAAYASGILPSFDLMASAVLLNFEEIETDRKISLKTAIIEGLANNLDARIGAYNPQIAQTEVNLAKSTLRPQADLSSNVAMIDETRAGISFGTQGRINWLASGTFSQIVFSEPALANIMIQDLLKRSEEEALEQVQLDVVLDVATAYLNVLMAKSFVRIQNENVGLTRDNYDISKAKESVGYVGASDLYRWKSELALRNIDLNDATAQLERARYQLNQLLNRPIAEEFQTQEVTLADQMLLVTDSRIFTLINNYGDLATFSDFMVKEAIIRLPELKQFDYSIAAQQRLQRSRERAFYLPSLALSGSIDQVIKRFDVVGDFPPAPRKPQWSIGLGLQYPLMQGGKRRFEVEQSKLNILQLRDQRANIQNQLELRLRAAMETAAASYSRVQLSQEAAEAGKANFQIVQDAYSQGLVQITSLIDAQNAALQTEISAVNAIYQFVIDFLAVERATGFFYFLATTDEQNAFFDKLNTFFVAKEKIKNSKK